MGETTASPGTAAGAAEQPSLRRVMGPGLLLLFVVGDILGTGIYALTGQVAARVGGAAWTPFVVAFFAATITAFSYLELVTKYPRAAGAALHAQGVRRPLPHLHGRLHGDVLGHHLGVNRIAGVRRQPGRGLRPDFGDGVRITLVGLIVHDPCRDRELPRRRRERQGQCPPHLRRADGPLDHHHDRSVGHRWWWPATSHA